MNIRKVFFSGKANIPGMSMRTGSFSIKEGWECWEDALGVLVKTSPKRVLRYPWGNIEHVEYEEDVLAIKPVKKAVA